MTLAVLPPLQVSLENPDWTLFRNVGIGLVVVLWLATAYWTFKDARRRIEDPWLVGLASLVGLFPPFLGPIIYMFFRPPEYIQDARERELEIKAMEERLAQIDHRCPVCRARGRAVVPRVPGVHDAAPVGVPVVRAAARVAVAGVPVLRHRHPAGPAPRGFHRAGRPRAPATDSAAIVFAARAFGVGASADSDLAQR